MDGADVRRGQKRFFVEKAGITDWNITTHQWRKAFAQFVIRTDSRMMLALRDHFRHLSIAMTEQGYVAADPEFKQILDDAAVGNSVAFLGALVTGKKYVAGPMVPIIREAAARLGIQLGNRSEDERTEDIEEIVRSSGIRVYEVRFGDADAGDCVYRPGTGRCTETCLARWVMPAPLWSAARPDPCWECQNLVVSDEHGDFWLGRMGESREAHDAAMADDDAALALLSRDRMAQCAMVLQKIGIPVPEELRHVP